MSFLTRGDFLTICLLKQFVRILTLSQSPLIGKFTTDAGTQSNIEEGKAKKKDGRNHIEDRVPSVTNVCQVQKISSMG